jgi:hypothetical protein
LIKNRCGVSVSGKIDRDRRKQPGNLGWNRENPFTPVSIGFLRRSGAGEMAWTAAAVAIAEARTQVEGTCSTSRHNQSGGFELYGPSQIRNRLPCVLVLD